MKNVLKLVIIIYSLSLQSQVNTGVYVSATAGYSQPLGDYESYTKMVPPGPVGDFSDVTQKIRGGAHFNLDVGYQFSGFGAGLSVGTYKHSISDLSYEVPVVFAQLGGGLDGMYFGVGPQYAFDLGGLQLSFMARGGLSTFKIEDYSAIYTSDALGDISLLTTVPAGDSDESLPYVSAGMQLGIPLSRKLTFIAKIDYLKTLGDGVEITDSYYGLIDLNQDGRIDDSDLGETTNIDFLITENRFLSPEMINVSAGLQYNFGITSKNRPKQVSNTSKIKPRPVNASSIVFNNPSEREREERILVALTPKDRSTFESKSEIKKFTWELIGERIPNARYTIEVTRANANGRPARTYLAQSDKLSIQAENLFKGERIEDGSYRWKVVENSTGLTSNNKTFTITTCDLDYSLNNDTIECLGYEGTDRKYKICFDTTYQSTTGNLDFINAGSGLFVYDQAYNPLSYTLVGTNVNLIPQLGNASSTVSYCFEVLVDATVTDIGFGIQGDDLDPSPLICQPSVSTGISDLPSCLCDECEDQTLSFDNFSTSVNANASNQLVLSGDLNASVPIYGVEFQIQSYSYSTPDNCTPGVTSVEESGVFLMPGTSINNSVGLQLANESVSGDPLSNTNATKNIKHSSLTALNGVIPVELMLGLPGPAMGMDASCCLIEYEVCIKVKVFYDQGSCKSCVFTQCFNFNNQ